MTTYIDATVIECGDDSEGQPRINFENYNGNKITMQVSTDTARAWSSKLYKNVVITIEEREVRNEKL